jgi:hypothetical protein
VVSDVQLVIGELWITNPTITNMVQCAGLPAPALAGAAALACSVVVVEDEPVLPAAAPVTAELPRASAANAAPPSTICLSRFGAIVFPFVDRSVPGMKFTMVGVPVSRARGT